MRAMKDHAIVCNIGHFDNEIEVARLKNYKWENIKPQVDEIIFPDGKRIILLAEGRLVNLGCAHGPPVVRDVGLVRQPDAGADRAVDQRTASTRSRSTPCPSTSTRRSPRLHLEKIGVKLTKLRPEQAAYIGVSEQRPVQAGPLPLLRR